MDNETHNHDLLALARECAEDTVLELDAFLDLSDMVPFLTETVVKVVGLSAALPCRACGGDAGAVPFDDPVALGSATDAVTHYLCDVGLLYGSLDDVTSDLFSHARVQTLGVALTAHDARVPAGLDAVTDALARAAAAGWTDEIDEAICDGGTYRLIADHPCSCGPTAANDTRVIVTPPKEASPVTSPDDQATWPSAAQKAAAHEATLRQMLFGKWLDPIDGGS